MRAYESAPDCYQCDNSFDNATLCYVRQSDEGNTTSIGCLLNIGICHLEINKIFEFVSFTTTAFPFCRFVLLHDSLRHLDRSYRDTSLAFHNLRYIISYRTDSGSIFNLSQTSKEEIGCRYFFKCVNNIIYNDFIF